jgi:RNA polymerase sigma-70 factor (ECF subfamily)
MNENDAELCAALHKCSAGDRQAFTFIYESTSKALFSIVRNFVIDEDLAHDVLQKGYLTIWKKASSFQDCKGRAFTWMLVIMRNQAIDEWRRVRRSKIDRDVCEQIKDEKAGPDIMTERALFMGTMLAHIDRLPPSMSLVIRQRFLNGKTSQEIADEYALSANTVRSSLRRGLAKLKENLPVDSFDQALTFC